MEQVIKLLKKELEHQERQFIDNSIYEFKAPINTPVPDTKGNLMDIIDLSNAVKLLSNAQLISAAPDLLEALRELLETCPCDPDITTEFWQANQKAKQAIEKALK